MKPLCYSALRDRRCGERRAAGGLFAMLALGLALSLALSFAAPAAARADEAPADVPRNVQGTCHIGSTWMVGSQSFFAVPSFSGLLAGAWPSSSFECLNHTAAAPEHVDASYDATLVGCSFEGGWVEYRVVITPPDATDGVTSNEYGLVGYQRVGGTVRLAWDFCGSIALRKTSAEPAMTEASARFSLQGATYGVFANEQAAASRDLAAMLASYTTDAEGRWASDAIYAPGTYYICELSAPRGYALSDEVTSVTVEAGRTTSAEASDKVIRGAFELTKRSRHLGRTGASGDGSLAGAAFQIVNASDGPAIVDGKPYAPGEVVTTVFSDESGKAATPERLLPFGTYTVRETKTSKGGYLLDAASRAWSATFDIAEDGQVVVLESGIAPTNDEARGNVELLKADADTGRRSPQGDATLAGAAFEIVNRSAAGVPSPQTGEEVAPGQTVCTIVTDGEGRASTAAADVNGWSMPDDFNGKALAYGTYEIREAAAPAFGYLPNERWSATFTVRSDGQVVTVETRDAVMRGRLIVGKVSREVGDYLDQGSASLEGWTFEVVNRSAGPVVVDGALFEPGEVVKAMPAACVEGRYVADTGERCLPYGTYEVREVQTMRPQDNGYLFDGQSQAWSRTVEIRGDGQVADLTGTGDACPNQVVRGDLEFAKAKSPGMERLAGVPFKVTSATTGEWHVIVTDRNGCVSTASSFNAHAAKTNANDAALRPDGTVDEALLDDEAGIWFDGRTDAQATVSEDKGALPFDAYTVQELPVSANAGLELVAFDICVYRDGEAIDLGTVDDAARAAPRISTTLSDANGCKVVPARAGALIVDAVAYENLDTGVPYTLAGEVHVVRDGQAAEVVATTERPFTPDHAHGTLEMAYEVDATALSGCSLVCFERILDQSGNEIAAHADATDEGQTVSVPSIGTTLADATSGEHAATLGGGNALELCDTVSFTGLFPNRAYTLTGTLHDADTGSPLVDANGEPVIASRSFTPREPDGTAEVTFAFSLPENADARIVAFEVLSCRGVEYATHADLADEGQTVAVHARPDEPEQPALTPAIHTTMLDTATQSHTAEPVGPYRLVDAVSYEGLQPGHSYTVTGTLQDKETGGALVTAAGEDGDGESAIASTVEFAPSEPEGIVEVPFDIDGDMSGKTAVAFERIADEDGNVVALHEDLDAVEQSVTFPTPQKPEERPARPAEAAPSSLAKTGDAFPLLFLLFIPAGALGLALAALSVRRMERERAITIERGRPRL